MTTEEASGVPDVPALMHVAPGMFFILFSLCCSLITIMDTRLHLRMRTTTGVRDWDVSSPGMLIFVLFRVSCF